MSKRRTVRFNKSFSGYGLRALIAAMSMISLTPGVFAFEPPPELVTDRPTKAANTAIVPPGYILWEAGFKFSKDDEDGSSSEEFDLLDSVFRIGVAEKVEMRLGGLPGKQKETHAGNAKMDTSGPGDAIVGIKVRLRDESALAPAMALILATTLPVGDDEFSSQRADPSATMAFSHSLASDTALVYNLGVEASTGQNSAGGNDTDTNFAYSMVLSYGRNPLISPFLEAYGKTPFNGNGSSDFTLGAGVTSLALPNLQLDASGGIGMTGSETDWYVGIGFSVWIPR